MRKSSKFLNLIKSLVLITLFLCCHLLPAFAEASDIPEPTIPLPETVTLDGVEYSRDEIIDLFLQVTIAEYELPEGGVPEFALMSKAEMEARYPWIARHFFRGDSLPKSGAINKWPTTEVTVSIGYPNKLEDFGSSWDFWWKKKTGARFYSFYDRVYYGSPFVDAVATETRETVLELTNINFPIKLSFIDSESESLDNYARIRIIPRGRTLEQRENPTFKFHGMDMTSSSWTN